MLGKLMKYEVRSCGRIFFPFYIVVLIFSIVASLFINFDNYEHDFSVLYLVGFLVVFALFVAAIVLTILLIVQRFNKSLLEDEGYLMFTLPVSQKTLVLSKFLTSLLFIILTQNSVKVFRKAEQGNFRRGEKRLCVGQQKNLLSCVF